MTVLASLRNRVFLASALLAVLSIAMAIYLVSVRVTQEAERALDREIVATRELVDDLRSSRMETIRTMARLVADAPTLKAAVDTDDPPTVEPIVRDYHDRLRTHLLLVTGRMGRLLASAGLPADIAVQVVGPPAQGAAAAERSTLVPRPDGLLQIVTVPILIGLDKPEVLGALSVGSLFDRSLAGQLKDTSGSDIAFAMDGVILATTRPDADRPVLAAILREADGPHAVTLGGEEFVAAPLALEAGAGPAGPVALILRSRSEHVRFLRSLHAGLAATGIVAVLLATILSFAVARTITRPLAAITTVMREVASTGDLTQKIALKGGRRWNDEDAMLLASTFNSLTDSIAHAQQEAAQKERLSSLGRLSTVIAHEIRNPLMIIKAALHTLRRPRATDAQIAETAADIDEEVRRLNRIVNEVLDFARPTPFRLAPANLNVICRESAEAAMASPGARIQTDLDPALATPVVTDADRLRLALVNLLVNARQAVEAANVAPALAAGGGRGLAVAAAAEPRVFLSTRATGGRVTIVVSDTGVGVHPEDLPRVFDPYFTTKRGGTGLGLPIARAIVEGLGGTLGVTSATGRGTEVRIELPLTAPS
jgi:signal transduction histidine kinase